MLNHILRTFKLASSINEVQLKISFFDRFSFILQFFSAPMSQQGVKKAKKLIKACSPHFFIHYILCYTYKRAGSEGKVRTFTPASNLAVNTREKRGKKKFFYIYRYIDICMYIFKKLFFSLRCLKRRGTRVYNHYYHFSSVCARAEKKEKRLARYFDPRSARGKEKLFYFDFYFIFFFLAGAMRKNVSDGFWKRKEKNFFADFFVNTRFSVLFCITE